METVWGGEGEGEVVMPQPPYGVAPGPLLEDADVLAAYARGTGDGHSLRFHVEGPALVVDGDVAAALRLAPDVVLVRVDLPDELTDVRPQVEQALAAEDLTCLDEESLLGLPVALQVLGLRLSAWDLWGVDIDAAFATLRRWAVGDQELPDI